MTGRIVLAATPIGNVDDASARLRTALETADIVAAEDTRRVRDLASRLGVRIGGALVAHHDHNEQASAAELVARAGGGETILVVSDAGMPAVSDPGFRVVAAAVAAGVEVSVLPGPSAALAALALSGLPTDRFCFEGFLPRRPGERSGRLASLALEERTMIFFEAPHRLAATLDAMAEALGAERAAAVSREITKTYEETRRGTLSDLAAWAKADEPRGEIVVTVAGRTAGAPTVEALVAEVLARVEAGERAKAAVADVASTAGVPSRELYAAVLAARDARA
ncbi:16S rRNA (cytidine(1402)-2'-O)-methyltransferase [Demequina mangrovi]|uniref:Ribosomal RNA small subunit methyltransferase I n=1 Tax=Demequina mangrovi TaxID=1043493 RepID=A0A1H6YHT6_9MICO|nr:16S rRNA (cytidine(1402)-2'-O)-methyltransferase [Demequina mangrovi]SEJ36792.1 16S rRNA (cytidine1402-2'-O)-methyltransferase [Demequina mangrovi]